MTPAFAHASAGYEASAHSLVGISLATDHVFRGGSALGPATVTGSVAQGFTAALTVAVDGA